MARMIPDILPEIIENNGELLFYAAARELPEEYTGLCLIYISAFF